MGLLFFLWQECRGGQKMKGRVCKECTAHNSPLGRLVAEGLPVASVANPIVYPGVVNTESRHPPLKVGTQTFASPKNFR